MTPEKNLGAKLEQILFNLASTEFHNGKKEAQGKDSGTALTAVKRAEEEIKAYISKEYVKREEVALQETKARIDELERFVQDMNSIRVDDGFVPIEYTYIRKRTQQLNSNLKGQED